MKDWHLARRDLLRHLGVGAACLPLLQATRSWGQAAADRRFVVLQMSEGLRQAFWRPPAGSLLDTALPPTLAPFESMKNEMIVIPGLTNPGGGTGHGSYGCVYYGMGGTGGGEYKEPTGKTVDQTIAQALPRSVSGRVSMHLQVQMERAPRISSAGGCKCFWTGTGQPINPVGDPYLVYKDVFAGGDINENADPAAIARLMAQKKSILDYVGDALDDFKSRLGTEDRVSIDAHHESVRQLEKQLSALPVDRSQCGGEPMPGIGLTAYETYPVILDAHLNLVVAALKCGVTRVATLQTGDSSGNNINFGAFVPGLPATSKNNYKSPYRNWHDLGHNPVLDGVDHKKIVDGWFMERWAAFFAQMKAVPEAGGTTLFDNTLTLVGNHLEEGHTHNSNAIPWMLFGTGWNYLETGTCIPAAGARVSSVMAAMCGAMGVDHPYGPPLPGLKKGA
jgi:Protein of unknown function (DUF1552)